MCAAISARSAARSATSTCGPTATRITTRRNSPSASARRWTPRAGGRASASSSSPIPRRPSRNPSPGSRATRSSRTARWARAATRRQCARSSEASARIGQGHPRGVIARSATARRSNPGAPAGLSAGLLRFARNDDELRGDEMRRIGFGMLAGAIMLAAALPAPAQAQDTIKIGLLLTYSGPFADNARRIDNGVQLYINQHGDSVAGKKIEIIKRDTTGAAPDIAKRLAQELVTRDKVDFLAGFVLTPNALAVADVA